MRFIGLALAAGLCSQLVSASSKLLSGGTIISFNDDTESFEIIRNGSILVTNDRIAAIHNTASPSNLPSHTEQIDVSGQIITPGFIDTHRHGWQTAFKTLASNTSLIEYFNRYSEFASATGFEAKDVYLGQLAGLYETLAGGVTTTLDHAHHNWSPETAYAGLNASVDSGARVFWSYTFHNITTLNYTIEQQIPTFEEMATSSVLSGSPTELGIAFDYFSPNPNTAEVSKIVALAKKHSIAVLTTHSLAGPWGVNNIPEDLQAYDILNTSIPVVFSHGSFLTAGSVELLRSTNQYLSITPESEMHYGHTHPHSYIAQDQAALGVDTHFTYSGDILTQARIWLQSARYYFYDLVMQGWRLPSTNPMSVVQAFHLATRAGGLALRRPDLGVIKVGAKADLVVWNARESPSLLGWNDPVAAVMLHASVGDVLHVTVDGNFVKRDGKMTAKAYESVRSEFAASARKIQDAWLDIPLPAQDGTWISGYDLGHTQEVDSLRGEGTGYGEVYLEKST